MKAFLARALVFAIPCVAMAQIAVLQIKIVDGEGAVHQQGARIAHPITVEVSDESGKPVAGAAVSFQLPSSGPSGLFSNGLPTDLVLTDAAGRATLHSLQFNQTGGQLHVRVTAVKEQARAGAVCTMYIGEQRASETPKPVKVLADPPPVVPHAPVQAEASSSEITRTPATVSVGSHKKWVVVALVLAAAGGGAFAGISHASGSKGSGSGSSSTSSSTSTIGTPTITIGNP